MEVRKQYEIMSLVLLPMPHLAHCSTQAFCLPPPIMFYFNDRT